MACDLMKLHKTLLQEVEILNMSDILSEMWLWRRPCAVIQNLGWTQLESTVKIIVINVENSAFGYNLTFEMLVKRGVYHRCSRTP